MKLRCSFNLFHSICIGCSVVQEAPLIQAQSVGHCRGLKPCACHLSTASCPSYNVTSFSQGD